MTTPDIWTVKDIAAWLKLSVKHVQNRLIHREGFPEPFGGKKFGHYRWLKDDVIRWASE